MSIYFAPFHEITTACFRRAFDALYTPADKYFAPFITVGTRGEIGRADLKELAPENNPRPLVPQILCADPDAFVLAAKRLADIGYTEVNLNAGCPVKDVVRKGRGAGLLKDPEALSRFLDRVFEKAPVAVSVKTRLGVENAEEWPRLLEVYARYPLAELIVHTRFQKDFYNRPARPDCFKPACLLPFPVVYNGDIYSAQDAERIKSVFHTERIMPGRGLLENPNLTAELRGTPKTPLARFHDRLYHDYRARMRPAAALLKMKELWRYWARGAGVDAGPVLRTRDCSAYEAAARALFKITG